MTWLRHRWEILNSSLWFVPALLIALAIALAFGMLALDRRTDLQDLPGIGLYPGGAQGARGVLSTIAGSMITVAGVVFSVTIVALTLASQQFGPRLLRRFLRDRGNQIVIGTFVAVFVYCLIVLRSVHSSDDSQLVPNLSVTIAVLLALASSAVLIYFIHHAAASLQPSAVLSSVSLVLTEAIDRIFPEPIAPEGIPEADDRAPALPGDFAAELCPVTARASGYLQAWVSERLLETAERHDLIVKLLCRPGDFVAEGKLLAHVWPRRRLSAPILAAIAKAAIVGEERTLEQDPRLALEQLVEVGVRALSPSLNDPFTALSCLDHLGAALQRLAGRRIPSPYRAGADGRLRLIAEPVSFVEAAEFAFGLLIHHGRTHAPVIGRVLGAIEQIAPALRRSADRAVLQRAALQAALAADAALPAFERGEREAIERAHARVRGALAVH